MLDRPRDVVNVGGVARAIRPRLMLLPSPDDAHDDPASDMVAVRAARAIGARAWQSDGADGLDLSADASPFGFPAQTASPSCVPER